MIAPVATLALTAAALLPAAPNPAPTPSGLTAPTDAATLRLRFLDGDLVSLERARAILLERGEDVRGGELGLLDDLSRLVRCLTIGPIPRGEPPAIHAARELVRLERIRLERRLIEGLHQGTALDSLLGAAARFRAQAAAQSEQVVRWPLERELWLEELPDPTPEPSACGVRRRDLGSITPKQAAELRAAAERAAIVAASRWIDHMPEEARARLAYARVLAHSAQATQDRVASVLDEAGKLESALLEGGPPYSSAGLLMLGLLAERPAPDLSRAIYRRLLTVQGRTDAEDSRARVRLVALLEPPEDAPDGAPGWRSVLEVTRSATAARAEDWPALTNAEARALYALGDLEGLAAFGRTWLRARKVRAVRPDKSARRGVEPEAPAEDPLIAATEDLLVRLALRLEIPEAIRWTEEIGPPATKTPRLEQLARLSLDAGRLDLAIAITDRLRVEDAYAREKKGPGAALDYARHTADRAIIEYVRNDSPAFTGFIDVLLELAREEEARPLSRTAAHRELARLCQELLGRLTDAVATDPSRRAFAGALLEGVSTLTREPSRWRSTLERYQPPLEVLAGPYAAGRVKAQSNAPAAKATPGATRAKQPKKMERPIRSLGEVVIPRLPPRLVAPDHPTPAPEVSTFIVYPDAGGALVVGAPWEQLLAKTASAAADRGRADGSSADSADSAEEDGE